MSERIDKYYVAPPEPPPSRHPPITEVGVVGWMRHNLFNGVQDTLITIVMGALVIYAAIEFLDWAIFSAQWEIAFLNLRQISAGASFPPGELWRIELAAYLVIFLGVLVVGLWGAITRGLIIALVVVALLTVIVPVATESVAEPPIYYFVDATSDLSQVNFVADEGDEIEFELLPLLSKEEFSVKTITGYIGNDNSNPKTSWDVFNTATQQISGFPVEPVHQVNGGQTDPSQYSLNVAIQVWNKDGEVIAESPYTDGVAEPLRFTWKAPEKGWYTFTVARDAENPGETGFAWLKVSQLEVFISTLSQTKAREKEYGAPPKVDCPGCATSVNRTDLLYNGDRTLLQWFSLQFAPFLIGIRGFYFTAVLVGAVGYLFGKLVKRYSLPEMPMTKLLDRWLLWGVLLFLVLWLLAGLLDIGISSILGIVLLGMVIGYALVQFSKPDKKMVGRGVAALALAAAPVLYILVIGNGSETFPKIETRVIGGLLLTLLLAAVAIVFSLPIGIVLALGRRSTLPIISVICTVFIEVVRGVPLITLLFMGQFIVPFFSDSLRNIDSMTRACIILTMFTSAYLAEVVRGGLQIIPRGQIEAAQAVGLSSFWITNLIVLPQALRAVIPAILGQFLSIFKDTSLVYLVMVSLFELAGTMQLAILGDTQTGYSQFPAEGWLFVFIIYFVFSFLMSQASRKLEATGSGVIRKQQI